MIDLIFLNGILDFRNSLFKISSMYLMGDNLVHVQIYDDNINEIVAFIANETTINGIVQTSGQMIIDTLSNA